MAVRDMLAKGEFNNMVQNHLPDGTLEVTLTKRGDPHVYKMWVRDLYLESETIIREEITHVLPALQPRR
jgi:predicted nucleotidyltransferase